MKRIFKFLVACSLFMFVGCAALFAPAGFITKPAGWNTIEMRKDITRDTAWSTFVSAISGNYDIEVLEKESGYLRTTWLTEGNTANRVIGKIESNNTLRFKVESRYYDILSKQWITGYVNSITESVKEDLQGRLR